MTEDTIYSECDIDMLYKDALKTIPLAERDFHQWDDLPDKNREGTVNTARRHQCDIDDELFENVVGGHSFHLMCSLINGDDQRGADLIAEKRSLGWKKDTLLDYYGRKDVDKFFQNRFLLIARVEAMAGSLSVYHDKEANQ